MGERHEAVPGLSARGSLIQKEEASHCGGRVCHPGNVFSATKRKSNQTVIILRNVKEKVMANFPLWFCRHWIYSALASLMCFFIIVAGVVRLKQWATYRKLMAFPHKFETVPVVRNIAVHFRFLFEAIRTGKPYGVLFWRTVLNEMEQFRNEGCFAMYLGTQPNLIIFRADHMEKILTSYKNISKGIVYDFLHPWLGSGLLTSTGRKWKQRRRLLTPAFHFRMLDSFVPIMNLQAKRFVERLATKKPAEDISPFVTAVTLDIVCETIMGVSVNSQTSNRGAKYLRSLKEIGSRLMEKALSPTQWIDYIYRLSYAHRATMESVEDLHRFTKRVITEKKRELTANLEEFDKLSISGKNLPNLSKSFLEILLMEHLRHGMMELDDIREEVDTFMFEGHDTTSVGLIWTIFLLGHHPAVQRKIQAEIDTTFRGDYECEVTVEHTKELKYLDAVLKESQRIYPPVPRISRLVTEEFEINGKPVPVGTELGLNILLLHRDPKIFPCPLKFDPERFCRENAGNRSPFAFIPFSAGPRNCIGQRFALLEEKIILVWLLRQFELKSLDTSDQIDFAVEMVLAPKCPIRVQCIPRRPRSEET